MCVHIPGAKAVLYTKEIQSNFKFNEIGRHSAITERGSEEEFFSLPNNSACA